ncbi:MAG: GumC family protein [Fimbriimonadaceae bacterium]
MTPADSAAETSDQATLSPETKPNGLRNGKDELDIDRLARVIRRYLWLILVSVIFGAGIAALYTYLIPPIYRATATLLLPEEEQTTALPFAQRQGSTGLVLKGVLQSHSAMTTIADANGMKVREVKRTIDVRVFDENNQMVISADVEKQERAMALVQSSIDVLEDLRAELGFSRAAQQAIYLEETLVRKRQELREAEDALLAFQRQMRTAPGSAEGLVQEFKRTQFLVQQADQELRIARTNARNVASKSAALPTGLPVTERWRNQLLDAEMALRKLELTRGPDAPEVVRARRETEITRQQLQSEVSKYVQTIQEDVDAEIANLVARKAVLEWQADYTKSLAEIAPKEAIELQSYQREVQTAAQVVNELTQQFEKARVDSETGRVRWSVLDAPYSEGIVNKSYFRNSLLGAVLGFVLGLTGAWVLDGRRKRNGANGKPKNKRKSRRGRTTMAEVTEPMTSEGEAPLQPDLSRDQNLTEKPDDE